jgi:hypothetical protein
MWEEAFSQEGHRKEATSHCLYYKATRVELDSFFGSWENFTNRTRWETPRRAASGVFFVSQSW